MLSLTILFVTHVYPCWFSIKIKGTNFISKYAQVQKETFERENTKTFFYFSFAPRWIFKFFFSIFEKLSLVGSKNRKLNCSGLRADKKYNTQKNPVCFLRPKKIKVFFTDPKKNPFDQNFRPEKILWTLPPPPPPSLKYVSGAPGR